jgi:DNA-binding CsgD family transcriptional regulator
VFSAIDVQVGVAAIETSTPEFRVLVDSLSIAVVVFRDYQLTYTNAAAQKLADRLRARHRSELAVVLRDHLRTLGEERDTSLSLFTGQDGEPFYVHVMPLGGSDIAMSVRELGTAITAIRRRYRLSPREAQVVELVLLGYRNDDIASTLGATPATIKKHLTHIFDKVGVDTRTQLVSRLA